MEGVVFQQQKNWLYLKKDQDYH